MKWIMYYFAIDRFTNCHLRWNFLFRYNKKKSFRLEIANVDARDMGTYKAVARNASGEGHATINLTFEEGMKIGTKNEGIVMCKNNRYLAMQLKTPYL